VGRGIAAFGRERKIVHTGAPFETVGTAAKVFRGVFDKKRGKKSRRKRINCAGGSAGGREYGRAQLSRNFFQGVGGQKSAKNYDGCKVHAKEEETRR